MAQQQKSAGSKAKKKTAPSSGKAKAPARRGSKAPAARKSIELPSFFKRKPKDPNAPKPVSDQTRSILYLGIACLILLFALIPGTRVWLAIHDILLGLFGWSVFFVPAILIYSSWLISHDPMKQPSDKSLWIILAMLICATAFQIFLGDPLISESVVSDEETGMLDAVKSTCQTLFENGKDWHGGGLIAGIGAVPLIKLFDITGAKIICAVLLIVLFMLLTNKNVGEMLQLISRPFVWIWNSIVSSATRSYEGLMDDFSSEYDDEDEEDPEDIPDDIDDAEADEEEEPEDEPADPVEEIPRFIRSSKKKLMELRDMAFTPADNADGQSENAPQKSRRRIAREEEKHMRDVAFILDQGAQSTVPQPDNIDVPLELQSETPKQELNQLAPETTQPRTSKAEQNLMDSSETDYLRELAEQAAAADHESRQLNRLPWTEPNTVTDAEPNAGVYEEAVEIPYIAPPLSLLRRADNSANDADKTAELNEKGKRLVDTLASFGVSVRIVGIRRGPTVTRYEIQPAAGVKISKITALADDIGLNLGGQSVRIEAPIPGKPAVGVEVPNDTKDTVSLREILDSEDFRKSESKLTFAVGRDIDGNVILGDISKMPHMIIAGTTGSGKSVCTNSIIMSILYHASPDEVRMVLIDPKVVEFQPYDGIPHLLIPVVTNPQKAAGALNWAVLEMERRYALCADYGVRDLRGYNAVAARSPELKKLPQILIIIDEFADLMMAAGKEVETAVIRIAQKARAAGIHLVIATQRPTVDVITGLIKSNVPSRIGMSVKSAQDSRIILDTSGAETLLGNGDLLFYPNGWREPKRVQGCFVSDREVELVTTFLKDNGSSDYDAAIMDAVEQNTPSNKGDKSSSDDDLGELTGDEALVLKAAELAVDAGQLSTTALQRRLKLGYAKAARIVDDLEERGIIGPSEGAKPRKVLMSPQELTEWKLRLASNGNKVD